jgi:hypothetical protein
MGISGKRQESIISCWRIIQKELDNNYIGQSGGSTMEKFQRAMISTIKILIAKIMTLKIWTVYQIGNIIDYTLYGWQKNIKTIKFLKMTKFGLFVKPVEKKVLSNQQGGKIKIILYASSVIIMNFIKNILMTKDGLGQKRKSVKFVGENFTKSGKTKFCVEKNYVKENGIIYTKTKEIVYCIEVEDCGVYFANGILVKNCDLSDRLYKKERENTKTMFQELQNIINRDPWCFIGNTGTSWEKNDVEILMPVGQKINCYQSGLITPEEIADLKTKMTPSLFAANYELKHIASDQQIFGEPQTEQDSNLIRDGVAQIDAAYGGGDTTALTVLNKRPDGSMIGYGKVYEKSVMLCIADIVEILRKYRVKNIWCEDNADKGYLARDLRNFGFNVYTYHESQNKDSKITTHGLMGWKKTKWIQDTDNNYLIQIVDYQAGVGLDDAPDSFASMCRQLEKGKAEIIYI